MADQLFELAPGHLAQGIAVSALGRAVRQLLALALGEVGGGCTDEQGERHEVLADRGQGLEQFADGHVAELAQLAGNGLGGRGNAGVVMEGAVGNDGQCGPQPPVQYTCEFEQALQDVVVVSLCHGGDPL